MLNSFLKKFFLVEFVDKEEALFSFNILKQKLKEKEILSFVSEPFPIFYFVVVAVVAA